MEGLASPPFFWPCDPLILLPGFLFQEARAKEGTVTKISALAVVRFSYHTSINDEILSGDI